MVLGVRHAFKNKNDPYNKFIIFKFFLYPSVFYSNA